MVKKILKMFLLVALTFSSVNHLFSQVTIGADQAPHDFSVLELTSDNKGLRLPQLTTSERNAWRDYFLKVKTGNPVKPSGAGVTKDELDNSPGLTIFNTETKCFEYWNASRWVSLCEGNSLMTIDPEPCVNVAADGTGCDTLFTVTDPDCLNGPFTIMIVAGQDYAEFTDLNEADGIFRIAFRENNSVYQHSVIVRVTSSCTGLYKDFLFLQDGHACNTTLGTAPEITSVPSGKNITLCANGAVYLSIDEAQITAPGTLADVIWTRNNIEVARGVNNIVVTQEGKYDVWMGYIGCNQKPSNAVTVTRRGTGALEPIDIFVSGNNGMVCGPTEKTELVAMNPNGAGTVLWFKNGILQDGNNGTDDIPSTAVITGTMVRVTVGIGNWFAVVLDGTCYSLPSETVTVIEDPNSGGSVTKPVIESGGSNFCAGSSILLSVSAGTYDASYTYIWYENNTQINVGRSVLYTVPSGAENVVIRCQATQAGSCAKEALTVQSISTGTIPAKPIITGDPVLCSGSATLNIIPTGAGSFTYAWYKDNAQIASTQSLPITSGGDYYATVSDGCTSPMAHIYIPVASSAAPSVNFVSSAPNPGHANTGDLVYYQASITFGPALSYTWTTDNATIESGGGINDDYAGVRYGAANSPAFVQVVVTNACGAATGRREVPNVGMDCDEAVPGTLNPSTEQFRSALVGMSFSLGPVSVQFGTAQTAYKWYRNTVKSTSSGTPTELTGMTNNTLVTRETTANTYYYYCVMDNANNCGAATVTSPFYTVEVAPLPTALGSGNFTGNACFDIAYSNFGSEHGTESARKAKMTDFSLTSEQDKGSLPVYTGTQVYTFTPSANISNVRFICVDATGEVVKSITTKADYTNNITAGSSCKAVVVFNPILNHSLRGLTRLNAFKPELYVVYNDQPNKGGTERYIKLTLNMMDCECCGAITLSGDWLNFKCHNLGANENIDPLTHVAGNADGSGGTLGYYYQWGRRSDGHELKNSQTTGTKATSNTPNNNKFITASSSPYDWRSGGNNTSRWGNGTQDANPPKGTNDPCPTGWKVPSAKQWLSVFSETTELNNWQWTGNGYKIGYHLYLPASGYRSYKSGDPASTGGGYYWSSTVTGTNSYRFYFDSGSKTAGAYAYRADGMHVRCIMEY